MASVNSYVRLPEGRDTGIPNPNIDMADQTKCHFGFGWGFLIWMWEMIWTRSTARDLETTWHFYVSHSKRTECSQFHGARILEHLQSLNRVITALENGWNLQCAGLSLICIQHCISGCGTLRRSIYFFELAIWFLWTRSSMGWKHIRVFGTMRIAGFSSKAAAVRGVVLGQRPAIEEINMCCEYGPYIYIYTPYVYIYIYSYLHIYIYN